MDTVSSTIQQSVEKNNANLNVVFSDAIQQAQESILGMLGNSYVVYEGDKILVVDALPKEEAHHVIMINSGGIAFSSTGINGTFESAWTIDNVLNMQHINVINLVADMIKGGTLKLGSNLNQNGQIEVYDEANNLIAKLDKNGLIMYGLDGSYLVVNKVTYVKPEVKTATFAGTTAKNVLVTGATYEKAALDSSKVTASTAGLDVDSFTVTAKDVTVK